MSSIIDKLPAYGMPVAEGPIGRPEKSLGGPPMDNAGGPGGPGGPGEMPGGPGAPDGMPGGMPGGPGGPGEMTGGPGGMPGGMPGFGGPKELKPSFPTIAPHLDPNSVPGSDIEDPTAPGPGFGGPPKAPPFERVESISVINGKAAVAPEPYADITGEISNTGMKNGSYDTSEPCINGLYIASEKEDKFTVSDCDFKMRGDGINDFAGIGSAIMVDEKAIAEVSDTSVETWGCIRPCTVAAGNSTLVVRNCTLTGHTGELPSTYVKRIASGMMEPPPGLEIGGTGRTHLSMGNSKAYFYDSKIYTRDWAALSTDSAQGDLYLEANNCDVICEGIGYGTYADNGCYNYLNDCCVISGSHGAIMAGESNVSFTNCDTKAGQYAMMIHSVRGSSTEVTTGYIDGGSAEAGTAIFFVKSTNAYIHSVGAELKAPYIIKSEINRDDAKTPVAPEDRYKVYGIKAYLQEETLEGDIWHEEDQRAMAVTMVNVKLTGGIHDAYISLVDSDWTATKDSLVCFVGTVDPNAIDALPGVTITAKAGEGCTLSGTYSLKSGGSLVIN